MNDVILEPIAERALALFSPLLPDDEPRIDVYQGIHSAEAKQIANDMLADMACDPAFARYFKLRSLLDHSQAACLVLDAAIASAIYPWLGSYFAELAEGGVSLSLCGSIGIAVGYAALFDCYKALCALLPHNEEETLFFRHCFYADDRIIHYLAGIDVQDPSLKLYSPAIPSDMPCALYAENALADEIAAILRANVPLQVAGGAGRGKKLLVRHALWQIGKNGIFADGSDLFERRDVETRLWRIRREVFLYDALLCVYGLTDAIVKSNLPALQKLCAAIAHCFCTDDGTELIPRLPDYMQKLSLGELSRENSIRIWEGCCGEYGVKGIDCRLVGAKFRLNPGQINKTVRRLARSGISPDSETILNTCTEVLAQAAGNVKQIRTGYGFSDLKVPDDTRNILMSICAHVDHRELVYGSWGLDARYPYGRSVSALFSGEPGTGKTMAAHVLSSTLGLPLYCIDLSQIVDKYIGETEKRLEQVFTLAEQSSAILFFDEADSLFGRRSEVNDAKDRYANIEVSYILQRLEQYDGVVLLATNNIGNIDEAFMRRIRYVVHFPLPDEALRREIWESCFAPTTPLIDVDLDFIARRFQLSGGDIKNIALNAAFFSAQSGGPGITMLHILQSIKLEYAKSGRVLMRSELGEYAKLWATESKS